MAFVKKISPAFQQSKNFENRLNVTVGTFLRHSVDEITANNINNK